MYCTEVVSPFVHAHLLGKRGEEQKRIEEKKEREKERGRGLKWKEWEGGEWGLIRKGRWGKGLKRKEGKRGKGS